MGNAAGKGADRLDLLSLLQLELPILEGAFRTLAVMDLLSRRAATRSGGDGSPSFPYPENS